MGKMATREAYGRTLQEIGSDEKVVVFDADLAGSTNTGRFKKDSLKDSSIWVSQRLTWWHVPPVCPHAARSHSFLLSLCSRQKEHASRSEIQSATPSLT